MVEPEEKPDEYGEAGRYTDNEDLIMPPNWPRSGEVEFRKVTIKYDVNGPEILRNINLRFAAGERVAVVVSTPFSTSPSRTTPLLFSAVFFRPGKDGSEAILARFHSETY